MIVFTVTETVKNISSQILDEALETIAAGASDAQDALAEIYRLTSTSVYGFALSILKNTHDAEDVLHDCYIHLYAAASSYRSSGKPMAWILTITRNLCMTKLRERSRRNEADVEDWQEFIEESEALPTEDRIIIRECMNSLSDEERQIVLLHALSGFKHREIAAMMSLPLATVLSKYNRAVKKLQKKLSE